MLQGEGMSCDATELGLSGSKRLKNDGWNGRYGGGGGGAVDGLLLLPADDGGGCWAGEVCIPGITGCMLMGGGGGPGN